MNIKHLHEIKNAIKSKYAWPGGYPLYLVMGDGKAMSIDAACNEWPLICRAIFDNDIRSGWFPIAVDINYENNDLYCCHSNEKIESAYGEE